MKELPENIKSVLVIQLAGLGDMVLATPAIHALKQLYPDASLSLLTNTRSADIVTGLPDIHEIFILKGIVNFSKMSGSLRSRHYDIVINLARIYSLPGALKMFLLFWLIQAKFWVGRNTNGKGFFYHLKIPEKLNDPKHEVESKLDIIRGLGAEIKEIKFTLNFDSEDERIVEELLNSQGLNKKQRLLAINCSTFKPSHNWPHQYYAQLANKLYKETKATIVFLGVNEDKTSFIRIQKQLDFIPVDFIGAFTVRQLVVFVKKCALLISPDSGVVHIANALGIPLVVLFGPGEYERYRPYNKANTIIINKNMRTSFL